MSKLCPHCDKAIQGKLLWASMFSGQTAHACPQCAKVFRLTYSSKRRLAFLNIVLLLGFLISLGLLIWGVSHSLRNLSIYIVIVSLVLVIMPSQVAYQKITEPYH
jgi:CXXC-20-CXXC protein